MFGFARVIRGWHISQHLTQSLTLKTLEVALRQSAPEIHHSDQGVQYLLNAYISLLRHHDIEISVACRGCPWGNGYAERLIRTLKEEEVHLNDYEDIHEARAHIGHFITQMYHHKRLTQRCKVVVEGGPLQPLPNHTCDFHRIWLSS